LSSIPEGALERLSSLTAPVLHPPKKHTEIYTEIKHPHKLIYLNNLVIYTAFFSALRKQLKKSPNTDRLFMVKT